MKKRIAIVIASSIYNQKGLFNAAHERSKHLIEVSDNVFDLFLISTYKTRIGRFLSREKKMDRPDIYSKDDLNYRIIWLKNTIFDYFLAHILHKCKISSVMEFNQYLPLFKDYDLIIGHSSGSYVWQIHNYFKIPYIMTWHGSDIHTLPNLSSDYYLEAKRLIENASHNFFVSKALLDKSSEITNKGEKSVSYNGRDKSFICYSNEYKQILKKKYSVCDKNVVAFVGNLIQVKNIASLPLIFKNIYRKANDTEFWIFGDGPLMKSLITGTNGLPVRFWGNVAHEQMVDYMNIMDVLVLPSCNEGLPLVTIEALSCGCNVVGSRVGGIPESIGIQNTVCLDDAHFEEKIAEKVVELMSLKPVIQIGTCFDWDKTAYKENLIIERILAK